ncbi:MAG TPA: DUF1592 domain-containing protein [Polyangiaceae bacterium]
MSLREFPYACRVLAALGSFALAGCSGEVGAPSNGGAGSGSGNTPGAGGSSGTGTSGTSAGGTQSMGSGGSAPQAGSGGASSTAGAGGTTPISCDGAVAVPKRIIRLSFNQIANAITSLFDAATAEAATETVDIPSPLGRTFPPLGSGTEGNIITDTQWSTGDTIAQRVATRVFENVATATGCGAEPTAECGRDYVGGLAERAFRRPLAEPERARLLAVFDGVLADGGSTADAVRYGVYAVFESPHFLYRTEFGSDANAGGALTQYELASELAFFITDAPPDADLLAAAQANALSTPEQIAGHATRLLAAPAARVNFEAAMSSYFALPNVAGVIIDAATIPGFTLTDGARSSIYHESELFLQQVLWNGTLDQLLTSRTAYVNSLNAPLYGLDAAGRTTDTFEPVELDSGRAGLLTLAAFLMSKSRPDNASVVGRGLVVNHTMLCQINPVFPEDNEDVAAAIEATSSLSQKEQADYRGRTPLCNGCHSNFDGFGLALERFDSIGRSRTMDLEGRVIDDAWTTALLPEAAGSVEVRSAPEMAQAILASGALQSCMAKNFIEFALADTSQGGTPLESCAVKAVVERFNASDRSFSSLMREIAASVTLAERTAPLPESPAP